LFGVQLPETTPSSISNHTPDGTYKLVNNLTFPGTTGTCLQITADFVTIDLAGFTISGSVENPHGNASATAIAGEGMGITVRNGSISGFSYGVNLPGVNGVKGFTGSIVEGLRVIRGTVIGIAATGIVKGNTVVGIDGGPSTGIGIEATGTVTGNYASGNRFVGISVGPGSTVIGNTAVDGVEAAFGISVSCPSNVTDNTAVNNLEGNLVLNGNRCNNTNNVAP
jgi:hypothetical protein